MPKDSSSPSQFITYRDKFLKKTTELFPSIEAYPDQPEIINFLCSRFVSSIFPECIRDEIYTATRLRSLRGKSLAHHITFFDKFVKKWENHVTFGLALSPHVPSPTAPTPHKPAKHTASPGQQTHTRVASVQAAPPSLVPTTLPLDGPCLSCYLTGHSVLDCPTRNCGYCAVHSRPSTHFPKQCHHFDYLKGMIKPTGKKVKTIRNISTASPTPSGVASVSSLPDLLDDSESSEVTSPLSVLFDSGSSEHIVPKHYLTHPSPISPEKRIELESALRV